MTEHRELPPEARTWVSAVLGSGEVIEAVAARAGATSSEVFGLTTRTPAGSSRRLVLRWYPDGPAAIAEPLAVVREADALRALADDALPGDPAWDIEAAFGALDWEGDANERWPGAIPAALAAMGAPRVEADVARPRLEGFVRRALARLG